MNIKHCIVQKKDSKPMMVLVSELEPPDESAYYRYHSEGMSWGDFLFKEYQESFKEYSVKDEEKFIQFLLSIQRYWLNSMTKSLNDYLPEGILIDAKKIKIENICCQTGISCGYPCNGEENCDKNKYAILVDEEEVKEIDDEETLWKEVDQILGNKSIESLIKFEILSDRFEIKRKQI